MDRPSRSILIVEDNAGDQYLISEALSQLDGDLRVDVVGDGEKALTFLRRQGAFAQAPRPLLVLLDMNLPRKGGLEVLDEMSADPELRELPVMVLTTSAVQSEVDRAQSLRIKDYLVKPFNVDEYFQVIREKVGPWITGLRQHPSDESRTH
jgi:CheY-like chemotaxis protein